MESELEAVLTSLDLPRHDQEAVRALLPQDGSSLTGDVAADLEHGRVFSARKDHTPVLWALDNGHKALAETYWMSERSVGEFARGFAFPDPADEANVKASLKNGILLCHGAEGAAREIHQEN